MADSKHNPEFLGGGPKFNAVGTDNRSAAGAEEVAVAPPGRRAYWLRVAVAGLLVALLAAFLLYLDGQSLGKTVLGPARGGQAISPDSRNTPPPASLQ